ncbi:MAG: hypothetical protein WBD36_04605 [Bacteroidota bacterium]
MTKLLKQFYDSITWLDYDPRQDKLIRQLRPQVANALTWCLVVLAIVGSIVFHFLFPH